MNELAPEHGLRELALFAGAGGGILGGKILGWRTVCAVEIDRYAREVLAARQNDGCLEPFPIWDDISTFDGHPWRGIVDVVSGGFPCQDISVAGKGAGIAGERSGLWREFARIIGEVRPRFVFVENSPALTGRGLGVVLGDLAALGYDARWGVLGAVDAGAPHRRERIWIVANAAGFGKRESADETHSVADVGKTRDESGDGGADVPDAAGGEDFGGKSRNVDEAKGGREGVDAAAGVGGENVSDTNRTGLEKQRRPVAVGAQHAAAERGSWWLAEPNVGRGLDGMAQELDEIKGLSHEAKNRGKQILQDLWTADVKKEIWETLGRFQGISKKEILLAFLCEYYESSHRCVSEVEGRAIEKALLRDLWRIIESARSSHQRRYSNQHAREYSNALRVMSRKAPSLFPQAWENGCWEDGVERVGKNAAARIHRLRCLGNGQVPAVAALAWEILSGERR
jgi:DNA (cytosine-5)-methyltransferase 1